MAETDGELARRLAIETGRLLVRVRPGDGDLTAQIFLAAQLKQHRPDDAVLSEEAPDDPSRLTADRVWIIDPLDGSREYAEPGRTDWAVHVALWERGDLVAGAVAVPAQSHAPRARRDRRIRIVVSRTRPPAFAQRVAEALDAVLVPMGSAGAKTMAVVRGEADAYLHAGGMYEWDSAAPVFVARAAGLHASRADGRPLVYNQPDPWLPDLLICRPELAGVLA
ncbi:3'(2'),5'-bisphosphate nucleotidase CysQ [Lentzea sp. BCCO 10_0856]|uniref:3'(2'),5'-bisphosphate nucleotidase CysQ n=1 Tax=Lentzea miocenica TaxID=3095431 RepID=A0ABU4T1A8_9PSEU|nr:3'(2'),5'-bisphosphate nucleotidase CysQ [Lentzea sp. BCCO 10_0856]MDX8031938.1 3'(2'),5'-bisphosphate nucleotidase CysQ [Lentzea sp. BCCO 10_0856]